MAFLLKNTSQKKFIFQKNDFQITDPQLLIEKFILEIKSLDSNKVEDYLFQLSVALKQPFPDKDLQSSELMTWDQIKTLSDNGMAIGSHSHDHSILSKQDSETLKRQLEKSIKILEPILNKKIKSISYPVGGYDHFNSETKRVAKDIGFKLGFSYLTGINRWSKVDPFDVKRITIQPEWLNLDLPLAFPNIFFKNGAS